MSMVVLPRLCPDNKSKQYTRFKLLYYIASRSKRVWFIGDIWTLEDFVTDASISLENSDPVMHLNKSSSTVVGT